MSPPAEQPLDPVGPPLTGRQIMSQDWVDLTFLHWQVDPAVVVPPPGTLTAEASALLSGQLTDRRGPLALLDVTAVFRLRDRLPRARRTA
mgnify:CR=1 FL=1